MIAAGTVPLKQAAAGESRVGARAPVPLEMVEAMSGVVEAMTMT